MVPQRPSAERCPVSLAPDVGIPAWLEENKKDISWILTTLNNWWLVSEAFNWAPSDVDNITGPRRKDVAFPRKVEVKSWSWKCSWLKITTSNEENLRQDWKQICLELKSWNELKVAMLIKSVAGFNENNYKCVKLQVLLNHFFILWYLNTLLKLTAKLWDSSIKNLLTTISGELQDNIASLNRPSRYWFKALAKCHLVVEGHAALLKSSWSKQLW